MNHSFVQAFTFHQMTVNSKQTSASVVPDLHRKSRAFLRFIAQMIATSIALIAIDSQQSYAAAAPPVDGDILSAKIWTEGKLPGEWKPVEGEINGINELQTKGPLFGMDPLRVVATWGDGGILRQISILYAEGDTKSNTVYRNLRDDLKVKLTSACGPVYSIKGLPRKEPEVYEFRCPDARVRLVAEIGKRVSVTLIPPEPPNGMVEADGRIKPTPPQPNPNARPNTKLSAKVKRMPNGDVILTGGPELDEKHSPFDDPEVAALAWIERYSEWPNDVVKAMTKAGYEDPGGKRFVLSEFVSVDLPKFEAVAVESSRGFNFEKAAMSIDSGCPVLVWRAYTDSRSDFHADFHRRWLADPSLHLPSAKERSDHRKWPMAGTTEGTVISVVSVVRGYNRQRGEVIFDEFGFGPDYKELRMISEEMTATTTRAFFFR